MNARAAPFTWPMPYHRTLAEVDAEEAIYQRKCAAVAKARATRRERGADCGQPAHELAQVPGIGGIKGGPRERANAPHGPKHQREEAR